MLFQIIVVILNSKNVFQKNDKNPLNSVDSKGYIYFSILLFDIIIFYEFNINKI